MFKQQYWVIHFFITSLILYHFMRYWIHLYFTERRLLAYQTKISFALQMVTTQPEAGASVSVTPEESGKTLSKFWQLGNIIATGNGELHHFSFAND